MFAPLVAQAKSTRPQAHKAADQTHLAHGRMGNQAASRFVAPRASRSRDASSGQEAVRSWDFSKIPVNPPGRAQAPRPFTGPRLPIQRKLKVGSTDDPLEHEADRVADEVTRTPAAASAMSSAPPQLSRKCAACEGEEKLQKKEADVAAPALSEAPASVHEALRSPGHRLDAGTRHYFEARFGYDFRQVRVHSSTTAGKSAQDLNASAYTVGRNIVFGPNRYAPETAPGRRLLAHELAHVTQQRSGAAFVQRQPRDKQPAAESKSEPLPEYKSTDPVVALRPIVKSSRDVWELTVDGDFTTPEAIGRLMWPERARRPYISLFPPGVTVTRVFAIEVEGLPEFGRKPS